MSEHALPTTTDETYRAIERVIEEISEGSVITVRPDADDTPVRDEFVLLEIQRQADGDWLITFTNNQGYVDGNFGPRPGNMLAGLFDYLRECNAGDWTAFNRATGKAI